MTDRLDFESRLEERLRARAALASRPFDAAAIARKAVAVTGRRRTIGRLEWASRRPALAWLVIALILAIAILGAVAGVGALLREQATPQQSVVAAGLQATWSSVGMRQTPGGCCPNRYDIAIGPATINIPDLKADVLSSLSIVGPDSLEIRVLSTSVYWECRVGDVGTYTFGLSSDGGRLTLAPVRDDCAARSAILAGEWTR